MSALRIVFWTTGLLWTSGLQAQPQRGMVYSQTQPAAIMHDCRPASESRITCSFTQLEVYKVKYPSVDQTLGTSWAPLNKQRCAKAERELEEELKKDSGPPPPPGRMRSEQRRIEELKARVEYCRTGSREAWREYLTREHDRRQKTCTIFAHTYVQTFRREPAKPGNAIHWVTEHAPYGQCKIHRESRFTHNGLLWNYVVRYKVMDKSAQEWPLRCEELREHEVSYSVPRPEETEWIDCEAVQFRSGCSSPDFPCLGGPPAIVH